MICKHTQIHTHKDGSDSITTTADAGVNKCNLYANVFPIDDISHSYGPKFIAHLSFLWRLKIAFRYKCVPYLTQSVCLNWNKIAKQLLSPLRKWSHCFVWNNRTVSCELKWQLFYLTGLDKSVISYCFIELHLLRQLNFDMQFAIFLIGDEDLINFHPFD